VVWEPGQGNRPGYPIARTGVLGAEAGYGGPCEPALTGGPARDKSGLNRDQRANDLSIADVVHDPGLADSVDQNKPHVTR